MSNYCRIAPAHAVHKDYHSREYGFPSDDETVLFERLCLEIFQAGLSWEIVLKKRVALNKAFHGFRVKNVAAYGVADMQRLLADPGIIRNRLKVGACIVNAQRVLDMRKEGGFAAWIAPQHPRQKKDWVKAFRKNFRFVGGEIVGEFLMSLGYLPGSHAPDCPIFAKTLRRNPPWIQAVRKGFAYDHLPAADYRALRAAILGAKRA